MGCGASVNKSEPASQEPKKDGESQPAASAAPAEKKDEVKTEESKKDEGAPSAAANADEPKPAAPAAPAENAEGVKAEESKNDDGAPAANGYQVPAAPLASAAETPAADPPKPAGEAGSASEAEGETVDTLPIIVQSLAGEVILKEAFAPATTMSHLKKCISDPDPDRKVQLLRNDKELEDTATLASLGLQPGDVLQAVFEKAPSSGFTAKQFHNLQCLFHKCPGNHNGELPLMKAVMALQGALSAGSDIGPDYVADIMDYDEQYITVEQYIEFVKGKTGGYGP